jgi:hypothetical protein
VKRELIIVSPVGLAGHTEEASQVSEWQVLLRWATSSPTISIRDAPELRMILLM